MTRDELIDLLVAVKGDVEKAIKRLCHEVVSFSEPYRYLGKDFTFDTDATLDSKVNRLLVLLGDDILDTIREDVLQNAETEEDKEAILAYVNRNSYGGLTPTERVDSYSTHLKHLVEGWLAIGFATGLSSGEILSDIFIFMRDPRLSPAWRDAEMEGFRAAIFGREGLAWGRGVAKSPIEGITLVGQTMITEAWQKGTLLGYAHLGASGYIIHRGSTYDCPLCDSYCEKVYPLEFLVLPLHPRCCCWTEPVYGMTTE